MAIIRQLSDVTRLEKMPDTKVMHSELSLTMLYLISNLQTPLRYSWYSSAAAETCLLLRVTAVFIKVAPKTCTAVYILVLPQLSLMI